MVLYTNAPEDSGITYAFIPGWHHQRVSHPTESKCPDPKAKTSRLVNPPENSGALSESSALIRLDPPRIDPLGGAASPGSESPAAFEREPFAEQPLTQARLADQDSTPALVRRMLDAAVLQATANPPARGRSYVELVATLAAWLDERGGDRAKVFARVLTGFFADEWVISRRFPLAALGKDPGRYLLPAPVAGPLSAPTTNYGTPPKLGDVK